MSWIITLRSDDLQSSDADTKLCETYNHNYGKRFTKIAKDDPNSLFEISEDPWCVSCYSRYKEICLGVSKIFKIPVDSNKTWKLSDLREKIDGLLDRCSKLINIDIVKLLYPVLQQICECLRSKLIHNKHCYRPKNNVKYQGNIIGDFEHDVYDICSELYRLYNTYILSLATYNSTTNDKLPNSIEKDYPDMLINCNSKIRTFQESMQFKERYLKNKDTKDDSNILTSKNKSRLIFNMRQSRTFRKTIKKRSRVKKDYKPKK